MKPFNLNEYLANPSRKLVTRFGWPARIICTDKKGEYSIIALISDGDDREYLHQYKSGGIYKSIASPFDLFFSDEQNSTIRKEGWITLYTSSGSSNLLLPACYVMSTKEDAEKHAEKHPKDFVAVAKVTWEE